MKQQLLAIFTIFLLSGSAISQQGDGGFPFATKHNIEGVLIDTKTLSTPNIEQLKQEDEIINEQKLGPWRFGYNNYVQFTMLNSGTWTNLQNGGKIWRLKVICTNALTVNLTLDNVIIPAGNELYVYNPEKTFILGKFTDKHLYQGELGTELVPGESAIVEYYIAPQNISDKHSLTINTVTHGYKTAGEFQEKAFGSSGNCNMNANCSDGDMWDNQRRSAIMLIGGSNGFCSGALVNNALNDGKPYVLTANHCSNSGGGPANWVFRFNWQADVADINQTDCTIDPGVSPSFQSISGSVLRAKRAPSDFCLVEITGGLESGTVPISFNPYFSGWDNSDATPTSAFCYHHPSGDIKKLSFDDDPLVSATETIAGVTPDTDGQWELQWDRNTTTEGGSSGSPLFDQNGRIIGQLWGGGASCWNLTAPDYYGKFSYSWNPSGSNSTNQLKFWLDPNDDGLTVLNGYDPTLSLKETYLADFNLFPNPSNGIFEIELPQEYAMNSTVIVLDLTGRILSSSVFTSKTFNLNLTELSAGNYIMKIVNDNKVNTKNISIQR